MTSLGPLGFLILIAPARKASFDVLHRIELEHAHSDDAINSEVVSGLEPRDRTLVTQIIYGTLRWRAWLDYILESAISRAWETVDPKARVLLRLSLYQMSRMDRVPDHAVINDAVELAKHNLRPGAAGFVNGVLRNLGRERPWAAADFHRDCPIWIRVSMPRWLWDRWDARFGTDRACEYALSLNRPPQAAFRWCGAVPLEDFSPDVRPSDLVPGAYLVEDGQPRHFRGDQRIQDEASQLIPHLFGSIEGARVWDACAAPGGKAAILRERCGSAGWLISSDLDPKRAGRMLQTLNRSAGARTDILVADARTETPFRVRFDAVLADVPCSGLGTLRRNPEIKWRFQPEWLREFSLRQSRILSSAAGAVREGGMLLYSTCSTEPEENEEVVEGLLRSHPEFRNVKPDSPPGIESWLDHAGFFRSYPSPRLWDGFFAALMVRSS
ncbi:MAG: transcription antitermination factor NusB [Acidobacteriota bacterium]